MPSVWIGASISLVLLALAAWISSLFFGREWGLGIFALCLVTVGAHHLNNLARLAAWLRGPLEGNVPQGSGIWEYIFSGMHRRVRARVEQQRQLAEALERFRTAGQAMPDGVILLNAHNQIEWINATAGEHFGLDIERDLGQLLTNLVRQPDVIMHLEAGHYSEPLITRSARIDRCTLSVRVVPYGARLKMLLSRDISQFERLEAMRRDFVANVSHELKTPLTVMSGFVEMLDEDHARMSADEMRHALHLVHDQTRRMRGLVEDLLTLSALESGSLAPTEERVEIGPLLEEVLADARALSAGRHVLTVDADTPGAIQGSRRELRSAFANLASNAVRYTPDGGRIDLAWRMVDGEGEFSVADTGIGIEEAHIPRLTERFYRVDRSRSRESGGTGLGLAIVKHVLTRHQARLEIESKPGRGSRFAIRLPARRVLS